MADDEETHDDDDEMLLAALDRLASEHAVRSSVPPDRDRASRNTCFVCGQPDPGYLSTNKHPEDAAPVIVCGVASRSVREPRTMGRTEGEALRAAWQQPAHACSRQRWRRSQHQPHSSRNPYAGDRGHVNVNVQLWTDGHVA